MDKSRFSWTQMFLCDIESQEAAQRMIDYEVAWFSSWLEARSPYDYLR